MNLAWAYVAAVFAAAVWLARRFGANVPWRIAALFYALVLVFLFRPLTQKAVNFPADIIRLIPPWHAVAPIERDAISNYEMQDVPMQMVPWAHQVRSAWRSLRLPLWNELSGCGYPLLGNVQSAAFSPVRLAALPVPMPYAMAAEGAMKLLVALCGTFLLCRRRYGDLASVVGAICYGFASYLIVWLHFPHATVAAFLPTALLGAELVTERQSPRRIAFAALAWAATIFGGHPETIADTALLILAFVVWVIVVEHRSIRGIAVSLVLALLIASPFIVPVAETLVRSKRFSEVRGKPLGIPFSDSPSLALLVQPRFYGALLRPTAWGPAAAESVSGFAGILGFAGFGAIVAHAIRRRRWREREVFFALASIGAAGVAASWFPVLPLTTNSRIRVLLCFCAAMLTAAFVDMLRERRRETLIGVAFAVAALAYPFWIWRGAFPTLESLRPSLLSIVPSAAVLLIAAMGWRLVLPIAVTAELWIAMLGWQPVRPASEFYFRTPLIDRLESLRNLASEPFRISAISESMFPNTQAMFGFEDVRVHDPMANARYVTWLQRVTRYDPTSYYAKLPNASSILLGSLNVRYVLADPGVEVADRYRLIYEGSDGRILENPDFVPRFYPADPSARVEILSAEPTDYRLRVTAPKSTLIQSSIASYPGWRISLSRHADAKRSEGEASPSPRSFAVSAAQDDVFVAFAVAPGVTDVRVHYVPLSFYIPFALSLLTIAGLGFMIRARV